MGESLLWLHLCFRKEWKILANKGIWITLSTLQGTVLIAPDWILANRFLLFIDFWKKTDTKLDHLIVKSLQEGVSIVLDLFLYHLCNLCLRHYLDFKFLFFRFYTLFSPSLLHNIEFWMWWGLANISLIGFYNMSNCKIPPPSLIFMFNMLFPNGCACLLIFLSPACPIQQPHHPAPPFLYVVILDSSMQAN